MFTYIDPAVRERLVESGKLTRIDAAGNGVEPGDSTSVDGPMTSILGPIPLPLQLGAEGLMTDWYASVRHTELAEAEALAASLRAQEGQASFAALATSMAVNSVISIGDASAWQNPLVRVHSSCLTGDVFGSCRCDCGPQFAAALQQIADDAEGGMIIYMSGHEGRGIGLWAKAATYVLQDSGEDTYQANRSLGLPDDCRDFSDAASLLKYFLKGKPFRLLTNNPKKLDDLAALGVTGITRVKHLTGVGDANRRYLAAKKDWGHKLADEDLAP